nr:PREDICTED: uncharacterized protein LOC109031959 [Bemisia tabaci]
MPKQCSFANCKNYDTGGALSFFRFPKDHSLCQVWLSACKQNTNVSNGRICQVHFSPEDFEAPQIFKTTRRKRLRKNAIPHLFNGPNDARELETPGNEASLASLDLAPAVIPEVSPCPFERGHFLVPDFEVPQHEQMRQLTSGISTVERITEVTSGMSLVEQVGTNLWHIKGTRRIACALAHLGG